MTQETTSYDEQETTSYSEDESSTEETQYFANFAMVRDADNIVQDVLTCLNTFKMNSYYFVEVADGVTCSAGMYYNAANGTFEEVSSDTEIPSS